MATGGILATVKIGRFTPLDSIPKPPDAIGVIIGVLAMFSAMFSGTGHRCYHRCLSGLSPGLSPGFISPHGPLFYS